MPLIEPSPYDKLCPIRDTLQPAVIEYSSHVTLHLNSALVN